MADLSPTTGQEYYSGDYNEIERVCASLGIDAGKMSTIDKEEVNKFQEDVDREIDAILGQLYVVPLRKFRQHQPDGNDKLVFPGDISSLARHWAASLLVLSQFQQSSQNTIDTATAYIEEARRKLYALTSFTHRVPGQKMKSNISRTMPPTLQPPNRIEPNF